MTGLRSYGDPCGIARALDIIGERWALLIVRELSYGSKRFSDLRGGLGLSPNVLTQRLGELEEHGVVQRRKAGGAVYELTDWGRELHPVLLQLGSWGARSAHRPPGELSVDALMLALEATFQREKAAELRTSYELRLGEERFGVDISDGNIHITRGSPRTPDAVIETDPATLRSLVFGDRQLSGAPVELRGDARMARAFFRLFARP
ncbi:MAG TPA: helix-turn-helix domain-containing protein [Polyangiaceae bacterium]|nr:helix-turn-helix domain-containing protein [Polyangiaceae bacterium]